MAARRDGIAVSAVSWAVGVAVEEVEEVAIGEYPLSLLLVGIVTALCQHIGSDPGEGEIEGPTAKSVY